MAITLTSQASLRNLILMFVAHNMMNTLLLSPLNPLRCSYWGKIQCSIDENWICNWLAFSHLHVTVLISCMMYKAEPYVEEAVAYMCCTIITVYLCCGVFCIDLLDNLMATIQCVFYLFFLFMVMYYTYEDPNWMHLPRPIGKMKTSSSFDKRQKIPLSTVACMMHFGSSVLRAVDMTFGGGRAGYLGDQSSGVYQAISNIAVVDMVLVALILASAVRYCHADQHKTILWGQVFMLLLSQAILASPQGEAIQVDMQVAGSIGTFLFMLVALFGAL